MKCTSCGHEVADTAKFCNLCGTPMTPPAPAAPAEPVPEVPAAPVVPVMADPVIPPQNKPLSPWAYYGLQLLFSIPLVGFICLIVFSLDNGNINRRNFARSYWCSLLITLVIVIILVAVLVFTDLGINIIDEINGLPI